MQLKTYKYIKNNKRLPRFTDGQTGEQEQSAFSKGFKNLTSEKVSGIVNGAVGFGTQIASNFAPVKSVNELYSDAGYTNTNIGGINQQVQNNIDEQSELNELNKQNTANTLNSLSKGATLGSSIGSVVGPVGSVIGGAIGGAAGLVTGLFGGAARKRKLRERMRNMRLDTQALRNTQMSNAYTKSAQQDYNLNHDYTEDDLLYANKGKDSMNNKVWSPYGYHEGPTNSKVGLGESIVNFNTGKGTLVTKGKKGVDNQNSTVQKGDNNTIFGNQIDPTNGISFANQAAPYTAMLHAINNKENKYKPSKYSSLSKTTQDVYQRELNKAKQSVLSPLKAIADRQAAVHEINGQNAFKYGKMAYFTTGQTGDNENSSRSIYKGIAHNPLFGNWDDNANYNLNTPTNTKYRTDDLLARALGFPEWMVPHKTDFSELMRNQDNFKGNSMFKGNVPGNYQITGTQPATWLEGQPWYDRNTIDILNTDPLTKSILYYNIAQNINPEAHNAVPVDDKRLLHGRTDGLGGVMHVTANSYRPFVEGFNGANKKALTGNIYADPSIDFSKAPRFVKNGKFVDVIYSYKNSLPSTNPKETGSQKTNLKKTDRKKLDESKSGQIPDYALLPSIATGLAGLANYMNPGKPTGSNIYAPNQYEGQGLSTLASARINPYSYIRPLYDAERRGAYQINNSGNPIGKASQRVALALGSQRNIGNILNSINERNIGYRQHYADAALNVGAQNASRRQAANQYDYETFSKAHAAADKRKQMGLRTMLQAMWNYNANQFKRAMANRQLGLYNQALTNDQQRILNQIQNG